MSICLSDLVVLPATTTSTASSPEGGVSTTTTTTALLGMGKDGGGRKGEACVRPLQGKNHVIFEDAGGNTYF
eukprot:49713-Eustigmatos_ZCMA.PRE.1